VMPVMKSAVSSRVIVQSLRIVAPQLLDYLLSRMAPID
jgi:hypothetical protein